MAAAEYVERQITVAIVIAVEEPPLLLAVQRIIGRIKVQNDLPRSSLMRLQEQIDQQMLDRHRVVADLVIARRLQLAQLQSVERRLAGHRRTFLTPRLKLAGQHRHHRIVAQLVVVVEILVAERDPKHPLTDQGRDLVLNQISPPLVVKARGKPSRHSDRAKATLPHPTSPSRHQMPLPQRGLQRFQNQTVLRYTLSASGRSSNRAKVAAAQRLSLIRRPDAPK